MATRLTDAERKATVKKTKDVNARLKNVHPEPIKIRIRSNPTKLTRAEVNEQIHFLMGWQKVPCDPTYQCPDGWSWLSPNGCHYEGVAGTVTDYIGKLAEAGRILTTLAKSFEEKPLDKLGIIDVEQVVKNLLDEPIE